MQLQAEEKLSLFDVAFQSNWQGGRPAVFDALREQYGGVFLDPKGMYVALDYEPVSDLMRRKSGISATSFRPETYPRQAQQDVMRIIHRMMLVSDGQTHTSRRRPVQQPFTAPNIRNLAGMIDDTAGALLDPLRGQSSLNLAADFSDKFPLKVIMKMLELPEQDYPHLKRLIDTITPSVTNPLLMRLDNDYANMMADQTLAAMREFADYCRPIFESITEGRASYGAITDGIALSSMTAEEMESQFLLIGVAGTETTTRIINGTMVELGDRPEVLAALAMDPALAASAAKEGGRVVTPFSMTNRVVLDQDLHVKIGAGMTTVIPAGKRVTLVPGGANRDPKKYVDPHTFDPARFTRPNQKAPLTFGAGSHFCLGGHLAELELAIAMSHLGRFEGLKLAVPKAEVDWTSNSSPMFWGPSEVPMVFEPHTAENVVTRRSGSRAVAENMVGADSGRTLSRNGSAPGSHPAG